VLLTLDWTNYAKRQQFYKQWNVVTLAAVYSIMYA